MVVASAVSVAAGAVVGAVAVLDGNPLLEAVLCEYLVAQVPLAHIGGTVIGVVEQFRQNPGVDRQRDVVPGAPGRGGPEPGHHGRAVGRADRLGDVGPLEYHALRGQLVEIGGVNPRISVGSHGIGALFIGPDEQQVRFSRSCPVVGPGLAGAPAEPQQGGAGGLYESSSVNRAGHDNSPSCKSVPPAETFLPLPAPGPFITSMAAARGRLTG